MLIQHSNQRLKSAWRGRDVDKGNSDGLSPKRILVRNVVLEVCETISQQAFDRGEVRALLTALKTQSAKSG
jgi:hypothetical protein